MYTYIHRHVLACERLDTYITRTREKELREYGIIKRKKRRELEMERKKDHEIISMHVHVCVCPRVCVLMSVCAR